MRRALVSTLILGAVASAARPAEACTPAGNGAPFATDGRDGDDTTPPGPVTAVLTFERLCSECPGWPGMITIDPTAVDDVAGHQLGYLVRDLSGVIEGSLETPIAIGEPGTFGVIILAAARGTGSAELEIRAVDRAGNVGPPTRLSAAASEGSCADGCAAGGEASMGAGLLLLGLALVRRRS